MNFPGLFYCLIHREIEHTRHRPYLFANAFPGADEHGIHKCIGSQTGLTNQVTQLCRAAEAAKASYRECHRESPEQTALRLILKHLATSAHLVPLQTCLERPLYRP